MKQVLIAIAILFSISATAQDLPNYKDSLITVELPRVGAWYIGYYIKQQGAWNDRLAPSTLKNYVGNNQYQDSLFTVTLRADYIKGMVTLLLYGANEETQADRLLILNNSPSIPGYSSFINQIVSKANGSSSQKQVAIWIRDYYLDRVAALAAARMERINEVINWANN